MGARPGVIAPVLGAVAATALLWHARGLDQVAREGQLGPGFWPRLVLIGLGAACVVKALVEWRGARPGGVDGASPVPLARGRLAAGVGLIVAYVLGASLVGFPLATASFIVLFLWLGGLRSPAGLVTSAVVGTVGLLYLFVRLVYLPLPKGEGPFEALTLSLYRLLRIF